LITPLENTCFKKETTGESLYQNYSISESDGDHELEE